MIGVILRGRPLLSEGDLVLPNSHRLEQNSDDLALAAASMLQPCGRWLVHLLTISWISSSVDLARFGAMVH
jgi:hypothetical protein